MELGLQGSAGFALGNHTATPATPSQETATATGHAEGSSWRSAEAAACTYKHVLVRLCACACVCVCVHPQPGSLSRILVRDLRAPSDPVRPWLLIPCSTIPVSRPFFGQHYPKAVDLGRQRHHFRSQTLRLHIAPLLLNSHVPLGGGSPFRHFRFPLARKEDDNKDFLAYF